MRTFKIIIGFGCFLAALLTSYLVLLDASGLKLPKTNLDTLETIRNFYVENMLPNDSPPTLMLAIAVLLVLTIGLIYAGRFLISSTAKDSKDTNKHIEIKKYILGIGCFDLAPFPVLFAIRVFTHSEHAERQLIYYAVAFFLVLAAGLMFSGWCLVPRLNSPVWRKTKLLIFMQTVAVGILIMAMVPNLFKARATSSANSCINNMRQIDAAANQFALEHHLTTGDPINFPNDLTPYIKFNRQGMIPPCLYGGHYYVWWVGQSVRCSLGSTIVPAHVVP